MVIEGRSRSALVRRATGAGIAACTLASSLAASGAAAQVLAATSIQTEQVRVVTANYRGPLSAAHAAVNQLTARTTADSRAVTADQAAQAAAEAASAAARSRLSGDQSTLAAAEAALATAEQALALDRAQLRSIAIGMYTGALTDPQPTSLRQLEAEQQQVIDSAEAEVVAGVVNGHLRGDLLSSRADAGRRASAAGQVASDQQVAAQQQAAAQAAGARTGVDAAALSRDQSKLAGAKQHLAGVEAILTSALDSVAGPGTAPVGQLSILGGSALTAAELVGWFRAEGYLDLTSAPIAQLASWYVEFGDEEGVRGDVAFAQAMLETGGFSSPDAVDLSNFAGIGHCDSCSSGWSFPSPAAGVLGQIQLLRIFADAGPGPAVAPALPSLTPGRQESAGCCASVQSLTGVWATDPTYGQQILELYGSILSFALATS